SATTGDRAQNHWRQRQRLIGGSIRRATGHSLWSFAGETRIASIIANSSQCRCSSSKKRCQREKYKPHQNFLNPDLQTQRRRRHVGVTPNIVRSSLAPSD